MTTKYDYDEDEAEEGIKTITDLFNKVFPIDEEKKLYGSILMRSFFGKNLDNIIMITHKFIILR